MSLEKTPENPQTNESVSIQKKAEKKPSFVNKRFQQPLKIITFISKNFEQTNIAAFSGQSAFFLMLSFLPFVLFCFSLLQVTPLTKADLETFIFSFIPKDFQAVLRGFIADIYDNSNTGILSITVITAIYLSSKAFYALIQGLNSMFRVRESRNFFLLHILSIIYSVFFALMIIATLAIFVFGNRILHSLKHVFPVVASFLLNILEFRTLIGFFLLLLMFLLLYRFLPNCSYRFRELLPGAIFATIGWLLFSFFYSIYINNFNNYASFYGAMTAIALLMVWLDICMYILLFGGIINYLLHRVKEIKNSI